MSKFKYKERDQSTVESRANQRGGSFETYIRDSVPSYIPPQGNSAVRILPPTWDTKVWGDNWGIEVWAHGNIGPDKGAVLCLEKMGKGKCPICEARAEVTDEEELKALKPGKRIICYVIDRDNEKEGPMAWNMSWTLEKDIATRSLGKRGGAMLLIDHPEDGYDIFFKREGKQLQTRYIGLEVDRDPTPIHDKESKQDEWLDFITDNPIPDLLIFHDYEYVDKMFRAKGPSKDEDDDERGSRRRRREEPEEGKSERRRGRDEPEERSSRSRRDKDEVDPDEVEEPRRGRREEPEEGSRRRGRDDKEKAEPEDKSEPEERSSSRRRREPEPEPEVDTGSRRRRREEPEGDHKEDDKKSSSKDRAKAGLDRLKDRGKR